MGVLCKYPQCTHSKKKEGYCRSHYRKVTGKPAFPCKMQGCKCIAYSGGYCLRHKKAIELNLLKKPPAQQQTEVAVVPVDDDSAGDDIFWKHVVQCVDDIEIARQKKSNDECKNTFCNKKRWYAFDTCFECYKTERDIYCCEYKNCSKNKLRGRNVCGKHFNTTEHLKNNK